MKLPPVSDEPVTRFMEHSDNARKVLDLESLLPSIQKDGIVQPLGAVELNGGHLREIWGGRRLGCARLLGMPTVPCRVFRGPMAAGDVERLALVENIQRLDLKPSECAAAFRAYMVAGDITARELAQQLGISDATVSRKLCIPRLAPELIELIDAALVPETSAPDLVKLDEAAQRAFAATIAAPISRDDLARAIGKRKGKKAERLYRLRRGGLSLVYGSGDLDALLAELEELKKAIRRGIDQGWDHATLARVLRVSAAG